MSSWTNEGENEECIFCQVLRRDDGRRLGYVVRHYEAAVRGWGDDAIRGWCARKGDYLASH